ncbi:MAG TPA: hypothetical protein ENK02_13920 [Planctomycetes bacterium]|nr:hypothetical protein [Planctomycetota bacterium]
MRSSIFLLPLLALFPQGEGGIPKPSSKVATQVRFPLPWNRNLPPNTVFLLEAAPLQLLETREESLTPFNLLSLGLFPGIFAYVKLREDELGEERGSGVEDLTSELQDITRLSRKLRSFDRGFSLCLQVDLGPNKKPRLYGPILRGELAGSSQGEGFWGEMEELLGPSEAEQGDLVLHLPSSSPTEVRAKWLEKKVFMFCDSGLKVGRAGLGYLRRGKRVALYPVADFCPSREETDRLAFSRKLRKKVARGLAYAEGLLSSEGSPGGESGEKAAFPPIEPKGMELGRFLVRLAPLRTLLEKTLAKEPGKRELVMGLFPLERLESRLWSAGKGVRERTHLVEGIGRSSVFRSLLPMKQGPGDLAFYQPEEVQLMFRFRLDLDWLRDLVLKLQKQPGSPPAQIWADSLNLARALLGLPVPKEPASPRDLRGSLLVQFFSFGRAWSNLLLLVERREGSPPPRERLIQLLRSSFHLGLKERAPAFEARIKRMRGGEGEIHSVNWLRPLLDHQILDKDVPVGAFPGGGFLSTGRTSRYNLLALAPRSLRSYLRLLKKRRTGETGPAALPSELQGRGASLMLGFYHPIPSSFVAQNLILLIRGFRVLLPKNLRPSIPTVSGIMKRFPPEGFRLWDPGKEAGGKRLLVLDRWGGNSLSPTTLASIVMGTLFGMPLFSLREH